MSLADELLADLEDEAGEEEEEEQQASTATTADAVDAKPDVKDDNDHPMPDVSKNESVRSVSQLSSSERFKSLMSSIESSRGRVRNADELSGPVEADPEYKLIVEANNLSVEIDEEIVLIYKFAKEKYSVRFPELETLVVQPLDYLMAAKELGNNVLNAKNNSVLESFLTQATIMVVSVSASTTQGQLLSAEDQQRINEACDLALDLNESKNRILSFVESRMALVAPNLSLILGAAVAAKLMGAAGGLTALAKMPSAHVSLLGQTKKTLSGFSQRTTLPHTGIVYYSDIVQGVPPDLRRKVARMVGDKCTLASRVDSFHEATDGSIGQSLRDEIMKKIDKLQEPPPVKAIKAMPAPLEAPRKKRGGKRVRKMKERYAVTELRKQANRMNFGEIEEDLYQQDLGYTRGNIGKGGVAGGGHIRRAQVDERTKVRISQTLKKNLQKEAATWGGTTTVKKHVSGTASSVAFTPLQGLEIVNPNAAESAGLKTEERYFSNRASFAKVKTPAPKTT